MSVPDYFKQKEILSYHIGDYRSTIDFYYNVEKTEYLRLVAVPEMSWSGAGFEKFYDFEELETTLTSLVGQTIINIETNSEGNHYTDGSIVNIFILTEIEPISILLTADQYYGSWLEIETNIINKQ